MPERLTAIELMNTPVRPQRDIEFWQWKFIDHTFDQSSDPLVPIGAFSPEFWMLNALAAYAGEGKWNQYKGRPIDGSLPVIFLRRSLAEALKRATELLPEDTSFLFWMAIDH